VNRVSKIITVENSSGFKKKALQWAQQFEEVVYLESNSEFQISKQQYKDYDAVLALGAQKSLSTSYKNAFQKLKQFQNQSQDFIFGHLNYDLKNDIEELSSSHDDEIKFPDLYFFQPKKIFLWRGNQLEVRYLSDYEKEIELDLKTINEYSLCKRSGSQDPEIRKKISKKSYFKKVANILEHIHRGDIYEVNF